jgi:hypothetical protein
MVVICERGQEYLYNYFRIVCVQYELTLAVLAITL